MLLKFIRVSGLQLRLRIRAIMTTSSHRCVPLLHLHLRAMSTTSHIDTPLRPITDRQRAGSRVRRRTVPPPPSAPTAPVVARCRQSRLPPRLPTRRRHCHTAGRVAAAEVSPPEITRPATQSDCAGPPSR